MAMLKGKVAFITGAASGIGRSTAIRFAHEGAMIALADVSATDGEEAATAIRQAGRDATFFPCNVAEADQVRTAIEAAVSRFGGLDIVVANAGINGVWAPIDDLQPAEWDKTLQINLRGTYLTLHYAIPHLKKSGAGSIIITSSVNGNRTFSTPGASAYSCSKAGQVALMKMAALELGRHNIRVNAVCPGYIPTNIQHRGEERNTQDVKVLVKFVKPKPFINEGTGKPEDVADACLYLASDLSRHVSGVDLYVDGGESLFR